MGYIQVIYEFDRAPPALEAVRAEVEAAAGFSVTLDHGALLTPGADVDVERDETGIKLGYLLNSIWRQRYFEAAVGRVLERLGGRLRAPATKTPTPTWPDLPWKRVPKLRLLLAGAPIVVVGILFAVLQLPFVIVASLGVWARRLIARARGK